MAIWGKKDKISKIEANNAIEAGQSLGMPLRMIVEKYFEKPNNMISFLRIYNRTSKKFLATELGISVEELLTWEESDNLIPFQFVPKIAKLFQVDLKTLLLLLGHAEINNEMNNEYKLAAQYSGDDLTEQQKIDLVELFRTIASK